MIGVGVGGAIAGGIAWLTNRLGRQARREDRLEERRRADYERALGAYSAMLRAIIDYRVIMLNLKPGQNIDAETARHREVRAVVSLVADPEIEQTFEYCLKFISEAALKSPEQRDDDLAAADLAYKTLVHQSKLDLEWRLFKGTGDVLNAAKPRFLGPALPVDDNDRSMTNDQLPVDHASDKSG